MPNRLLDALTCAPGQDPAKTTHGETLKWGTGIRWEYQTDEQGVGPLLLCGEDTTSGLCDETLYQGEIVTDDPDNIGTIETCGLARMMWLLAHIVPHGPKMFMDNAQRMWPILACIGDMREL